MTLQQKLRTKLTEEEAISLIPELKKDNMVIECAKSFYLDYMNNYITLDRMCEDYYMSINEANNWLNIGRELNQ